MDSPAADVFFSLQIDYDHHGPNSNNSPVPEGSTSSHAIVAVTLEGKQQLERK